MLKKSRPARRIRKDYQRKNLKNPFFRKCQEGRGWHFFRWFFWLGLALIVFLAWFFLLSPWWRLAGLEINGLTRRQSADIENLIWQQAATPRWLFFKQSNLLLFDVDQASQALLSQYNFAGVTMKKSFPRTLKINISERPYAFIFQENGRFAYADAAGYLITEVPVAEEDKLKYFILENQSPDSLLDQKNRLTLKKDYLDFAFELSKQLAAFPDLPLEKLIIDQELNTLKAKFVSGPTAFFSIADSALDQVGRLALVKKEKIGDNFNRINYIDLRFGSRVYINPEIK